jgi:hypothetical protein
MMDLDKQVVEALKVLPRVKEVWRGPGVLVEAYWIRSTYGMGALHKVMDPFHVSWMNGPGPVNTVEPRAILLWSRDKGYQSPAR